MDQGVRTLGELGDKLFRLYAEKDALNIQVDAVQELITEVESTLLAELEKASLDKVTCSLGSVSRTAELYPKIVDFDEFMTFVVEGGYTGMVQKRISSKMFKEYFSERGEYPPGTDGTTGFKLNRRKGK